MTTMRKPKALRKSHDDSLVCIHRDTHVCPECAARYAPACFEVYSKHYWVPDEADRAVLLSDIE